MRLDMADECGRRFPRSVTVWCRPDSRYLVCDALRRAAEMSLACGRRGGTFLCTAPRSSHGERPLTMLFTRTSRCSHGILRAARLVGLQQKSGLRGKILPVLASDPK